MSTSKKSDSVSTMTVEPDPASNPDPITGAPGSGPVVIAVDVEDRPEVGV